MQKDKGYLLPSGDAFTEDIACAIVFYPDKTEYRRALLGSLSYLATWIAWEKESEHKGIDAALAWKNAFDLTVECWDMACFEQLQSDVAAILEYLQNSACCADDNITTGEPSGYETEIEPGVGDDPTHYGETAVSDWDEWLEYLCYSANAWVDNLVLQSANVSSGLQSGGMSLSLLSVILIGVSFFVVGGVLGIGFLMLGIAGLVASGTSSMFDAAGQAIEDARDDIVCAIINGGSLSDAVEDALSSGTAWDIFYTLIDYDSATAILYEGGDGTTYLDAEKDDSCSCDQIGEFIMYTDWETGTWEDWDHAPSGIWVWEADAYEGSWTMRALVVDNPKIFISSNDLRDLAGGSGPGEIHFNKISFYYKHVGGTGNDVRVLVHDGLGQALTTWEQEAAYTYAEKIYSPVVVQENSDTKYIHVYGGAGGGSELVYVDNITIDYDWIPD